MFKVTAVGRVGRAVFFVRMSVAANNNRYRYAIDGQTRGVSGSVVVIHSTGHGHQIDDNLIGHSDDRVTGNVCIEHLVDA